MEILKKIFNGFTTILVLLVVILAMLLAGVRVFGIDIYTVLSGSMEPTYQTGSVIYVKDVDDPYSLTEGDIITFAISGGDTLATHRIIEVVNENGTVAYRTKGDANDMADGSLVSPENIIGKPIFTVPKLGYLISYMQTKPGRLFAIAGGALILLLVILPDIIFEDEDKKKEKKKAREREDEKNE
ncbi:MAG: signal peptidase I [Eubacteriaceae bacterium]|nr:signal peptidase I [Eubacteriaceae bacterium]